MSTSGSTTYEWFIERVRATAPRKGRVIALLEECKQMKREGWRLTVLQELASGDVIAFGCRERP